MIAGDAGGRGHGDRRGRTGGDHGRRRAEEFGDPPPAFSCSSGIETNHPAASAIARTTSGGINEPPTTVTVPWALIKVLTPIRE